MMRFYKEVNLINDEKQERAIRMMSKASKMSVNRGFVYNTPSISKTDFHNLGKTSKKFGQSQPYQYSDKTSNQLNGRSDKN